MPSARSVLMLLCCLAADAGAQQVRVLVQSSPLAGFSYHEAARLWPQMKIGDHLTLHREADNPHDSRAIRVEWRGRKLGYVPRAQNEALAWAMDQGQALDARISRMEPGAEPRRRIEFEVFVE